MTKHLQEGQYFGQVNHKCQINGITVSDAEYTHSYVDWHGHENPYFTFLLQGQLIEQNKKERYELTQGSLLFHNWQDYHCNMKPDVYTRGAHIEINQTWFESLDVKLDDLEGSMAIINPNVKNLVFQILLESKRSDSFNEASVEMLLIELLGDLKEDFKISCRRQPDWIITLEEMIYNSNEEKLNLQKVSSELNLHPVYLSRAFHKYKGISFGKYCRAIRLNRTMHAILSGQFSFSDIAYLNHYFDQSHMTGEIRRRFRSSPKEIQRLLG